MFASLTFADKEEKLKVSQEDTVSLKAAVADHEEKLEISKKEILSLKKILLFLLLLLFCISYRTIVLKTTVADKENKLSTAQNDAEHFKSLLDEETTKHTKGNALHNYFSRLLLLQSVSKYVCLTAVLVVMHITLYLITFHDLVHNYSKFIISSSKVVYPVFIDRVR